MQLLLRSRTSAILTLAYLLAQFPLTTIPVATQFEELVPSRKLPVSIVQVAVAIYSGNENIPKDLMRLVLLPASAMHDACKISMCRAQYADLFRLDCSSPLALDDVDGILDAVRPRVYRSDIVRASIIEAFKDMGNLFLTGCSVTFGTTLMSLFIPARMGMFAYLLLCFIIVKMNHALTVHAFLFGLMLAISADLFKVFGINKDATNDRVRVVGGMSPPEGVRSGKQGKRRAPRDTVTASEAKKTM